MLSVEAMSGELGRCSEGERQSRPIVPIPCEGTLAGPPAVSGADESDVECLMPKGQDGQSYHSSSISCSRLVKFMDDLSCINGKRVRNLELESDRKLGKRLSLRACLPRQRLPMNSYYVSSILELDYLFIYLFSYKCFGFLFWTRKY